MRNRILITGGAGFLGAALARRLLERPAALGGAQARELGELVLLDLVAPPADLAEDP